MKLDQLLDTERLTRLVENRLVGVQHHPTLPLRIYNYTHGAQHDSSVWGDGTIDYCRGLIVDFENNIVSRPFKKFWNLNTSFIPESQETSLPKTLPTITEKMDGSPGILYRYDEDFGVVTRGSFMSPQAQWATKWLHERIQQDEVRSLPSSWTWLFEIIYDQNRIVLKYSFEGLVVLAAVEPSTGAEMQHELVTELAHRQGYRVVRQIRNKSLKDLLAENRKNEEGYVVTYSRGQESPLKLKIKFEDYCRIHKIVTGMNPRSVWELMRAGSDLMSFAIGMPDTFVEWLRSWETKLRNQYTKLMSELVEIHANRPFRMATQDDREYRKACALYFEKQNRSDLKSAFFRMLSDGDPSEVIWDLLEPRGDDKSFRVEGE